MARIRFQFATMTLEAELLDTPTARAVAAGQRARKPLATDLGTLDTSAPRGQTSEV